MNHNVILITGEYLIVSSKKAPLRHGALAIRDGFVIDTGKKEDLIKKYPNFERVDRPSGLIAPGLINSHTHAPMVLFRGLADDLPLKTWLEKYIFPRERALTPELIRLATRLSCAEMIRSGTTAFVDMYFFERVIGQVAKEVGMRAYLGEGLLDFPTPSFDSPKKALTETISLYEEFRKDPLINVVVAPHTPYTCNRDILLRAKGLSERLGIPLTIHLSETKWEYQEIQKIHGKTPVEYLDHLGILDERLIAFHTVWLNERDMDILSKRKVNCCHCPESNLKLGSGIMPLFRLLERGVNCLLGTDGAASNNDLDMLSEMDFCAKLPKGKNLAPEVVKAEDCLQMATLNAGVALFDKRLGTLEKGSHADLFIIDLDSPHLRPCFHPVSQIVYVAKAGDVTDTMVAGKFLMKERRLLTIDERALLEKIKSYESRQAL